ncbi:hypothetical protein HCC61_24040 [Streptomyces sp. HNM0575]|uniref:putative leader peptide n=1 Tax=Streptomyces sp. HNM0575 TaxID=2716338 RepID=UPI00145C71E1|nr:putative leader peptide [Streptomyces sp. HNM0575]NLU75688.1 hypothetical protein [Streptomyces sp. HNM0575]
MRNAPRSGGAVHGTEGVAMQCRERSQAYDAALGRIRDPRLTVRRHIDLHRVSSAVCHA